MSRQNLEPIPGSSSIIPKSDSPNDLPYGTTELIKNDNTKTQNARGLEQLENILFRFKTLKTEKKTTIKKNLDYKNQIRELLYSASTVKENIINYLRIFGHGLTHVQALRKWILWEQYKVMITFRLKNIREILKLQKERLKVMDEIVIGYWSQVFLWMEFLELNGETAANQKLVEVLIQLRKLYLKEKRHIQRNEKIDF